MQRWNTTDADPTALARCASAVVAPYTDEKREILSHAESAATRRMYASVWQSYTRWCDRRGRIQLPTDAESFTDYLTELARTRKIRTVLLHATVIATVNDRQGHPRPTHDPRVRVFMRGLRRAYGAPAAKKAALDPKQIAEMVAALDLETLAGLRDRALVLVGFACACRRTELAALDVSDLTVSSAGLSLRIRRSKTDQNGVGTTIGIPRAPVESVCPVVALESWLHASGIQDGAVFRSVNRHDQVCGRLTGEGIASAIKRSAEAAGIDPTKIGGHSLRSGFATSAARAGESERQIARQTRHKSMTVLREYIHEGSLFLDNPATGVLREVARASHRGNPL
jgi:integrase